MSIICRERGGRTDYCGELCDRMAPDCRKIQVLKEPHLAEHMIGKNGKPTVIDQTRANASGVQQTRRA